MYITGSPIHLSSFVKKMRSPNSLDHYLVPARLAIVDEVLICAQSSPCSGKEEPGQHMSIGPYIRLEGHFALETWMHADLITRSGLDYPHGGS